MHRRPGSRRRAALLPALGDAVSRCGVSTSRGNPEIKILNPGVACPCAGWHGAAHGPLLNALSSPAVSVTLGSVALLGPGRPLIRDGLESLLRWSPL